MGSIHKTMVRDQNYNWFRCLPKSMEKAIEELKKDPENWYGRKEIRVVVAGDPGTGKSSLITAVNVSKPDDDYDDDDRAFDPPPPGALEPTVVRSDFHPRAYPIPITVFETDGGVDDKRNAEKFSQADVIVLTFASDANYLESLYSLRKIWTPGIQRLEVNAPIIVVGCKWDLIDNNFDTDILRAELALLRTSFPKQIVDSFLCCTFSLECMHLMIHSPTRRIGEVFLQAQSASLAPRMELYGLKKDINSKLHRALLRILFLYDHDKDGLIKAEDFKKFKEKCFGLKLREMVERRGISRGYKDDVTFEDFIVYITHLFRAYDFDTLWTVLRQFGYNSKLEVSDVLISSPMRQTPYETVELSYEAINFLSWIFNLFDRDHDGALTPDQLIRLFRTAPKSPFNEDPYKDAAEKNGLSLDGFLSLWALMALLDPNLCFKNLLYLGYSGEPTDALCVTRKRTIDCQLQQPGRNVFQCFVFGPKKSGKSALLDSFLKRLHHDTYTSTSDDCYAVNVVDQSWGKILVLREFPEDTVDKLLLSKEALANCDVAVFVYDSSDVLSKNGATNLLKKVADHCIGTGLEIPFRYVAAKHCSLSFVIQQVCQDTLLPITTEQGNSNDIFYEIAKACWYKSKRSTSDICDTASQSVSDSFSVGLKMICDSSFSIFW